MVHVRRQVTTVTASSTHAAHAPPLSPPFPLPASGQDAARACPMYVSLFPSLFCFRCWEILMCAIYPWCVACCHPRPVQLPRMLSRNPYACLEPRNVLAMQVSLRIRASGCGLQNIVNEVQRRPGATLECMTCSHFYCVCRSLRGTRLICAPILRRWVGRRRRPINQLLLIPGC